MKPQTFSWWDRLELALVRWLTIVLAILDRMLGVQWGERLLGRMADRWQAQLADINRRLAHLETERSRLQRQIEAMSIQAAVIHLGGRQAARGVLRLDPADPTDERILDAAIELLVKRRLSAIQTEEMAPGRYVYYLEPDWGRIRAYLAAEAKVAGPEIADWLEEGIRFLDQSLLDVGGLLRQSQNPE